MAAPSLKKQAERLVDYLEKVLDWNVYSTNKMWCVICEDGRPSYAKYCEECGAKLVPNKEGRDDAVRTLQLALKYAQSSRAKLPEGYRE